MKKILLLIGLMIISFSLVACSKKPYYETHGMDVKITMNLNGAIYREDTTELDIRIKKGDPLLDPMSRNTFRDYIHRPDYTFKGWFYDEACTNPVMFETARFHQNTTLYAKWEKNIQFTYDIYYVDVEKQEHLIHSVAVSQGGILNPNNKKEAQKKRPGFTLFSFFQDAELTIPWDDQFQHPGEQQENVKVYTSWLEGEYELVSTYQEWDIAILSKKNIYLLNDIDGMVNGKRSKWNVRDYFGLSNTAPLIIEGNGCTIKNFQINYVEDRANTYIGIFREVGAVEIRNLTFDNFYFEIEIKRSSNTYVSPFIVMLRENSKTVLENITITSTFTNQSTKEIDIVTDKIFNFKLNGAILEDRNVQVSMAEQE